jgi:parallel beta-helix repeat protein
LSSLLQTKFNPVEVKAPSGYPVHNLNTGLNYTTIQGAIDAPETLDGHTIFVEEGAYYENVYLNKTVTLIGENRETTIINASRVGNALYVIANNVTVSNFTITGSELGFQRTYGIYVNSSNNAFFNNIIAENNWGIGFDEAHNNTVSSNLIIDNLVGHTIEHSDNNTFKRNVLRNNGIGFYSTYSDCNVFDENIAETEDEAILVTYAHSCTFRQNTLIDNTIGFWIEQTHGCLFVENSVVNSRVGIRTYSSHDNVIISNNITGNDEGLFFHDTSRTTILHNSISKNNKGIAIYGGSSIDVWLEIKYNSIINNTIGLWNSEYLQSKCAQVSQNNFINNTVQAENDKQTILQWNAEYPSGGNYWDDYVAKANDTCSGSFQNETGSDGIGDASYFIDANNKDNYPLMGMFSSFNTSYGYAVDFISNSSISDFSFNLGIDTYQPEAILAFNVSGDSGTDGFLRVCIPKILINGSYIIRFDDETITNTTYPQVRELPCSDETYTYFYINYTHSEHKIEISGTTIVPEFPSFLILPLFMVATLLALIVYRRKHTVRQI